MNGDGDVTEDGEAKANSASPTKPKDGCAYLLPDLLPNDSRHLIAI